MSKIIFHYKSMEIMSFLFPEAGLSGSLHQDKCESDKKYTQSEMV